MIHTVLRPFVPQMLSILIMMFVVFVMIGVCIKHTQNSYI